MMAKNVSDVMTPDPEICAPSSTLREVAQLMVECDCGEIPVCDEQGIPVGVVTDRDIVCRVIAVGKDPGALVAEDCMSSPVITATLDTSIEECTQLMEHYQLRRLPVVDERGVCCGIVAQADLATKGELEAVAEVVEKVSQPNAYASGVEWK
jgi:CBS domain-containing protein